MILIFRFCAKVIWWPNFSSSLVVVLIFRFCELVVWFGLRRRCGEDGGIKIEKENKNSIKKRKEKSRAKHAFVKTAVGRKRWYQDYLK